MARLVTLATAKKHLRVVDETENADIDLKVVQASDIIVKYLKNQADVTWTDANVPAPVQAAVLVVLTHLYEHRGEDMNLEGDIWTAVKNILNRWQDYPAFA